MDARIRGQRTGSSLNRRHRHRCAPAPGARSAPVVRTRLPPQLAGLRVALVHDWLTGIAGARSAWRCSAAAFPRRSFIP